MSTSFRNPTYPIDSQFLERWSPRAFANTPVTDEQVLSLLEAARWTPSASNLQPWRFIYALKDTPEFDPLLSLLVPFNQGWATNAGALIFATSVTTYDGERAIPTHSFDTGAAAFALALQAHKLGLVAHGMGGLEYDKAPLVLGLPDNVKLEAAFAIGYKGDPDSLPDFLKAREAPSDRQPLSAMVFKGRFSGDVVNPAA
jgi:nitroreductase